MMRTAHISGPLRGPDLSVMLSSPVGSNPRLLIVCPFRAREEGQSLPGLDAGSQRRWVVRAPLEPRTRVPEACQMRKLARVDWRQVEHGVPGIARR